MAEVKGYKVFRPDWTCRPNGSFKQYGCPGVFEDDVAIKVCDKGMHFCRKLADCFTYQPFDSEYHVCEVIALGDVEEDNDKCCTNKLEVVRELDWTEVLDIVNTGKGCTGYGNSGDNNSGYGNSGDNNSGYGNSGDNNSGNRNSGNRNSGYGNSGDNNSGNRNSGNRNSGNRNSGYGNSGDNNSGDNNSGNRNSGYGNSGYGNSGDWNYSSYNSGCFNTEGHKIMLFDKPSDWTYEDWLASDACWLLRRIPQDAVEWVYACDMSDQEKADHPECITIGGYLRKISQEDRQQMAQDFWNRLSKRNQQIIKDIPNFDAEKFRLCTGIDVDAGGGDNG